VAIDTAVVVTIAAYLWYFNACDEGSVVCPWCMVLQQLFLIVGLADQLLQTAKWL
jgi:hypothetical protein